MLGRLKHLLLDDNSHQPHLIPALNRLLLSAILKVQFIQPPRETDMRATLSKQKGNIPHKDIQLHEHSVLPREEKLATP